jgi:hypothetical protein
VVIAPDTVGAVRCAGGWLFDRVMAGWDVSVLCSDETDPRALRILGARPLDTTVTKVPPPRTWPQALAVDAALYASNEKVRQLVVDALRGGTTEVRLWEECDRSAPARGTTPVQYRLSLAAQAFKAQAMAAADLPVDAETMSAAMTEVFRTGRPGRPPRTPEPVPAA